MADSPVVQHLKGMLKQAEGRIQEMSGNVMEGKVKQMEGKAEEEVAKFRANYHDHADAAVTNSRSDY